MPIVSVNLFGRFGNQMFQYATARAYAERYKAEFNPPKWIGSDIFDLKEELAPRPYNLPTAEFDTIPDGKADITLHGYFQHSSAAELFSLQRLREWFALKPEWQNIPRVKVAAHLRYGDYLGITNILMRIFRIIGLNALMT